MPEPLSEQTQRIDEAFDLDALRLANRAAWGRDIRAGEEQQWSKAVTASDATYIPALEAEVARQAQEIERLRSALRRACDDGWADGEAAMRGYLEEVTTDER